MNTTELPPCPEHTLIPATDPGQPVTAWRCVWCCWIGDTPAKKETDHG